MAESNEPRPAPETTQQPTASVQPVLGADHVAAAARPRRRRGPRRLVLLFIVGFALLAGGVLLWRYLSSYESTDDAQVDAHLYPVSARVSGYVIKVNVADNQEVRKGDVVVEIDPRDYQVALDRARADLSSAEATAESWKVTVPLTATTTSSQLQAAASDVENARAGIGVAQRQLLAAHAQVEQAEANDRKAQDDLARYKMLVEKQEVSAQVYDQALAAAKTSAASVAAAQANEAAAEQAVQQAKSRLGEAEANHRAATTAPQQVASTRARALSASADVQLKRAALDQAELNLQYTKIVAPVSGRVSKNVVVGWNVQAGQQLLTIVPLDEIWITANFKETQLKHMRPGQAASISVDSNGRTYRGRVDSIAGATGPLFSLLPPENATGNYVKIVQRVPVKIVLNPSENRDQQLLPGMNVVPKVYVR